MLALDRFPLPGPQWACSALPGIPPAPLPLNQRPLSQCLAGSATSMDPASFQDRCHPSHQTPGPSPSASPSYFQAAILELSASHRLPRRFPQSKIQPPSPASLSKDFNVQPSSQLPQEVFSDPLARSSPPRIAEGAIYLCVSQSARSPPGSLVTFVMMQSL